MKTFITAFGAAILFCFFSMPATAETVHLEAEDYMALGEGIGFHDNDVGNNSGQYRTRPGDDVDIESCSEGGYNVCWTGAGEWFMMSTGPGTWSTDPSFAGGDYYAYYRTASLDGDALIHVEIDGVPYASTRTSATGGWQNWTTDYPGNAFHRVAPIAISAGSHQVKFVEEDGGFNLNWLELTTETPYNYVFTPMRELTFTPPQGGVGFWGVREVWNAGDVGNIEKTVQRLNSGAGTIVDYTAPVINLWDDAGNGYFGNDAPFGVVTAEHVGQGSVDHLSMVMSGTVRIPTTDTYTFIVDSDDGFELAIDGNILMEHKYGRAANDSFAKADLTAGDHEVRLLYWEGGWSGAVELSAALGDKDAFDGDFRLIGHQDGLQLVPEPSTWAMLLGLAAIGLISCIRLRRRNPWGRLGSERR